MRGWRYTGALAVFVVAGSLGAAPVQQIGTVQIPNLVAHWPFDETSGTQVADVSGNNNHGTHRGTVTIDPSVPPFPGGGRSRGFVQTGGTYIDVPNSASLRLTGSFTLAAWINATDGANQHGIIEKWTQGSSPQGGYFLRLNSSEHLNLNTVPGTGGAAGIQTTPRVVPLGQWIHVAGVFNNGGTSILYVNGVADATTGPLPAPAAENALLRLGRDYGGNGLNGLMDEPRIYDRALAKEEIDRLRLGQAPPGPPVPTPGPGSVDLTWVPAPTIPNVTVTYVVKRADTSGGPYTVIAQGLTQPSYTDSGLVFGGTYYYVVSAVSVIESANSLESSTTTLNPTPRTKDHQEGFIDDNCACGSSIPAGAIPWAGLLLLGAAALRRRR